MTGIELIKEFEGLRLQAYRCPAGVWTIGWGHTADVKPGMKISAARAEELLSADTERVERQLLEYRLNNNQRAALVSFGFNVGTDALKRSTLLRLVAADPADTKIGAEFERWVYAKGQRLPGLVRRRRRERQVYES